MRAQRAANKVPKVLAVEEAPHGGPGDVCVQEESGSSETREEGLGERANVQAPEVSASKRAHSYQISAPILYGPAERIPDEGERRKWWQPKRRDRGSFQREQGNRSEAAWMIAVR